MVNSMSNLKLDKKFLIIVGCLILVPLLLIVFLVLAQGCTNKKNSYSKYEFKMESAAKKYLTKIDNVPSEDGEYIVVDLNTLVENSYITSPKKALNDSTCTGYISARKEGKVSYVAVLNCDGYRTNTLSEALKKDLTTDSEGLYKTNDGYVFRGLNVNNYLTLGGVKYRIMGITNTNAVKAYKVESENIHIRWDYKYNVTTKAYSGINIYKDSNILERLNDIYATDAKIIKIKSHLVPVDVCVHSVSKDVRTLNNSTCKEKLENQYITLMGMDDFVKASLDPNCIDMYSKSCVNYNYIGRTGMYTWTKDIVADNNYQSYYLDNGIPHAEDVGLYYGYHIVLHLNGDEIVQSGNGTKKTPYVIK